jgi:glycosyltransferase involved in cell wall biosynthesis
MSSHDGRRRAARNKSATGRHDPEVLIVGPYPPPLGGVSSHVQRATVALRDAGYTVGVLNHFTSEIDNSPVIGTLRRNPVLYFLKLKKAHGPVVHYHHAGRLSLLLAVALARPKRDSRWLVTIHNHSLTRSLASSRSSRRLVRWALGRFDQVIAVSREIAQTLERHGVDAPVVVMPAYIPAAPGKSHRSGRWPARDVVEWSGVTLIVSAYRVSRFDGGGDDVYGLDIAVKIFVALAREGLDLRLAVFLAHAPRGRWARRYLDSTLACINPELQPRLKLLVGETLLPAFDHQVVYLRPTRTDGDAVSVREALDAAVPVVASDVVWRPPPAQALPIEDIDLWRDVVAREIERVRARARTPLMADFQHQGSRSGDKVVALYRSQLDRISSTAAS